MMKKVMNKAAVLLGLSLAFGACRSLDEESVNGNSQLQIRLTDAPGDYDAVFIEIEDVLVHRSGEDTVGEEGWESVEGVRKGTYNLLDLVNGRDTLLVDADVPSGHLGHIRLVLGENNRLEIDGQQHTLEAPSAGQSGLKLKVDRELSEGIVYGILLDFDVARSVVQAGGSGRYILKPVIRVLEADPPGGTLRGIISPGGLGTAVLAVRGTDTLGTYTDTLGNFMLKAVPPGNYSMHFLPESSSGLPRLDTAGITVNAGEVTQVNVSLDEGQE
ncbi:MAG TPA: DUF4382 domain-containing protein [Anseongella sp.]|nr:DUF4382 domain-containing protein [Anseongella sp.]